MLETPYINLTHTYYTKESSELAEAGQLKADEFLEHVKRRSTEEKTRAEEVLIESSVKSVHDTTDSALLTGRLKWLANEGVLSLVL